MKLKSLLVFAVLAIAMLPLMGCTSVVDGRKHPNFTWNWPDAGTVKDKRIDEPLTQKRIVNGNVSDVVVRKEREFWLDIEDSKGLRTWVKVSEPVWNAAAIDQPWRK